MLCYVMLCYIILCYAVLCYTISYYLTNSRYQCYQYKVIEAFSKSNNDELAYPINV